MSDELVIAGRAFRSRLIVGTGKYRSFAEIVGDRVVIHAKPLGSDLIAHEVRFGKPPAPAPAAAPVAKPE